MDVKKGIRVGIMSANLPVPAQYDNEDRWVWLMKESAKWGCNVIHLSLVIEDENPAFINKMRDLSQSLDMALEVRAIQELFSMTDANASDIRKAFETRIKTMKILGSSVMRMGYGRLKIESSRFNKNYPLNEHLDYMKKVLKFAAKIVEENGVYLAIENHCDFKGEELADVLSAVNSYNVGCALDTANGYTVYNDPDAEVEVLAPFAITTHIKDMGIIQETAPGRIPFRAVGTALGDGNVNIPKAIDTIIKKGRNPDGIRLIVERGWCDTENMDKAAQDAAMTNLMKKSIDYLLKYAK